MKLKISGYMLAVAAILGIMILALVPQPSEAQGTNSHFFPETKHTVSGIFWKYWQEHGGLAQQGFPISEEFTEVSDLDGKSYTVQYFERAVFEKHPEKQPPFDVLLSQLGTFQYRAKYGTSGAPNQKVSTQNPQLFPETGFYVGGLFLQYWQSHGGLPQQGYPISNEFTEVSDLNGQPYTVQYFERAVFEYHPEYQPPSDVLLSQLGTFQYRKKYGEGGQGAPTAEPTDIGPIPTAPGSIPTATSASGATQPSATNTSTGTNCTPVTADRKSRVANSGPVAITDVHYQGQEYVEITNKGSTAANIGGWLLRDKNDSQQQFTFPTGTQLPPGASIQVYTEPGHDYTFNKNSAIWNNCGDALELLDTSGSVVATYAYGTHLLP